jgi:large-conductance mechanosensitive channel
MTDDLKSQQKNTIKVGRILALTLIITVVLFVSVNQINLKNTIVRTAQSSNEKIAKENNKQLTYINELNGQNTEDIRKMTREGQIEKTDADKIKSFE